MKATASDDPRCHHCGYSLVGLDGSRCPECGNENPGERPARDGQRAEAIALTLVGCALAAASILVFSQPNPNVRSLVLSAIFEGFAVGCGVRAYRTAGAGKRLVPICGLCFTGTIFIVELTAAVALFIRA